MSVARVLSRERAEIRPWDLIRIMPAWESDCGTLQVFLGSPGLDRHRRGPVADAVAASMSMPGIAPPIADNGRLLIDGGVLDNLPVDVMAATDEGPVIAVDVMGHGREALAHAALTRFTLRAYLQAGLEPRAALAMAGRVLADPNYERYATAAVGIYDADSRRLTYALAGHPPPILIEFGCLLHEPLVVCSSPPIGWMIPTGRRQTTVSLAAGAEACFFSDGLVEARRGGEVVGRERLHEILARLGPHARAGELIQGVRACAERVADDMVACVLSPHLAARGEHVHVEELEVDACALERDSVRRFLRMCAVRPPQVGRALKRAAHIVAASGTALLRVQLAPGHEVAVAAPTSTATRV